MDHQKKVKWVMIVIALAVAGITATSVALAASVGGTQTGNADEQTTQAADLPNDESVNDEADDDNDGPEIGEQDEIQPLASSTAISADQARQAAEAITGEKASQVELEEENGVLVYGVEFASKEVTVDANTGTVIQIEDESTDD